MLPQQCATVRYVGIMVTIWKKAFVQREEKWTMLQEKFEKKKKGCFLTKCPKQA